MKRQLSNQFSKLIVVALAVVAAGVTANTSAADEYSRINGQTIKIRNKTRVLLKETDHYRLTPNYKHLVADTAELRQLAELTREVARHHGDLDHLAANVAQMDQIFHHLEDLFDNTELLASQCQGSVKGHTAHVKRLLNSIEDCIHRIQDDLAVLRSAVVVVPKPVVVKKPIVVQKPILVPRPVVAADCPYGSNGSFYNQRSQRYAQQRPVVTAVETFKVPASSIYGNSRSRGGFGVPQAGRQGGGFSFSLGGGSSAMNFNF